MSKQVINVGSTANDNNGDTLRGSWIKANANFDELYGNLPIDVTPTAWTPALTDSGGGCTFAFTTNTARHTSIGFVSTFTVDLTINSVTGSATGNLRLTLPDPVLYEAAFSVWLDNGTNQAKTAVIARAINGTSYCEISHFENGDAASLAGHVQATSRLIVSGTYFTS
jgi:hypothetical protein